MRSPIKKEKGFTLIEIVLVMAIAGLIMVIVFLAVSGAQKSRRDTQRKNDLSRIAAQIESYASNTNGLYPNGAAPAVTWAAFTALNYITQANLNDPLSGNAYAYAAWAAAPATGTVTYRLGTDCAGGAGNNRVYSVNMGLEQGVVCRDNR